MEITQIERMENTLIEVGYGSIYNEWDLKRMLFLLDYNSYYYDDAIGKLIEDYEDVELYEVGSFEQLAEEMVEDGYYEVEIDGATYIGRCL